MKVLILGGTGVISGAVVREASAAGAELTVVTRGTSSAGGTPPGVSFATGDIRTSSVVEDLLARENYDVAIDFLAFTPAHVAQDIEWFRNRVGQFVFISSASAYQTPPLRLPITESTPLRNPYWEYSRDKIACEDLLIEEYRESGFPVTVVRPSHTYDGSLVPIAGGWTAVELARSGRPVIVPDDGHSRWTLTHASDFARAFVQLLGRDDVAGDAFHITCEEAPTWREITEVLLAAAGAEAEIVQVPSAIVAAHDERMGASIAGDKANTRIFDNTKIRDIAPGWSAQIPWAEGAREIVEWHDADPSRRVTDERIARLLETVIAESRGL
nr:NAD-dependent epimerase/dehydratase family protein [Actinomycetales bacterium]